MIDFVFKMVDIDPSKRGTATELLSHPFLKIQLDRNKNELFKSNWKKYVKPKTRAQKLEVLENILDNVKVHCGACAIFSENAIMQLALGLQLDGDEVYNEFVAAGMRIERLGFT